MKTTKPFSTISFNTEEYMKLILDRLCSSHVLTFYSYIRHEPEQDEKKVHYHVFMIPAKSVQTEEIREEFLELVSDNPKPLGCLPCDKSVFTDWFFYSLHDIDYLASKGMTKMYHYGKPDLVTSDLDYLDELIRTCDSVNILPVKSLAVAIENGESFTDYVLSGKVPIQQLRCYADAYQMIVRSRKLRSFAKQIDDKELSADFEEKLQYDVPDPAFEIPS